MKEFILIIRVPADYSSEDAKSVTTLWDVLTDEWKEKGFFATSFVFPSQGFIISNGGANANRESVVADGLKIVSTIIVRAENYEDALTEARRCPILQQGGNVEVVEIMSRPVKPAVNVH
ncbi:MAG TPA: hypothetical protein VFI33_10285 [Puia sp.]|nr:hypothetical protein [Puia sp.]